MLLLPVLFTRNTDLGTATFLPGVRNLASTCFCHVCSMSRSSSFSALAPGRARLAATKVPN